MKELIESFRKYMKEPLQEYNPCKDDEGHTASCKTGNLYSLTKKGADRMNAPDDKVKRGTITSTGKLKSKFGAQSSKKKSCGRKTIAGEDIPPKYSCLKYPEKYQTEEIEDDEEEEKRIARINKRLKNKTDMVPRAIDSPSVRLDKLGYPKELQALSRGTIAYQEGQDQGISRAEAIYLRAIIKDELEKALSAYQGQSAACSFQQILKGIQAIKIAESPPKGK